MALGLLLCDDLIFTSRITGTARDLGVTVKAAPSVNRLQSLVRAEPAAGIIVDLANPGLAIEELLDWLRDNIRPMPPVVAYGSHVDTSTLRRAREAGCHPVLPRSKFVEDLPTKLLEWLHPRPPTPPPVDNS
jgi:CheY-like chemotaxis protein